MACSCMRKCIFFRKAFEIVLKGKLPQIECVASKNFQIRPIFENAFWKNKRMHLRTQISHVGLMFDGDFDLLVGLEYLLAINLTVLKKIIGNA